MKTAPGGDGQKPYSGPARCAFGRRSDWRQLPSGGRTSPAIMYTGCRSPPWVPRAQTLRGDAVDTGRGISRRRRPAPGPFGARDCPDLRQVERRCPAPTPGRLVDAQRASTELTHRSRTLPVLPLLAGAGDVMALSVNLGETSRGGIGQLGGKYKFFRSQRAKHGFRSQSPALSVNLGGKPLYISVNSGESRCSSIGQLGGKRAETIGQLGGWRRTLSVNLGGKGPKLSVNLGGNRVYLSVNLGGKQRSSPSMTCIEAFSCCCYNNSFNLFNRLKEQQQSRSG
jgi:hypothetical protein